MAIENLTPETAYLTKPNIVHPESNRAGTAGDARVAADEVTARTALSNLHGVTVTGGSIKKGK
jgi:hypothetical protein